MECVKNDKQPTAPAVPSLQGGVAKGRGGGKNHDKTTNKTSTKQQNHHV